MARKGFSYQTKHYRRLVIGAVLPIALMMLLVQVLWAQQSIVAADIVVDKSVNQEIVQRGDTVTYLINMNNIGEDSVSGAVMTDTVPADLTVITASVTGGYDDSWGIAGNTITWTGSISGSEGVDISFEAVVLETAVFEPITNTVYVTGTGSLISDSAVLTVTDQISYLTYMPISFKPPLAPILLSVSPATSSNGYDTFQMTATWSDVGSGEYELQQSNSSDFSNSVIYDAGDVQSKTVTNAISQNYEYYFRVRYIDESGVRSVWSNAIKQYGAYIDLFNHDTSGWKIRREDLDDSVNYAFYDDGIYKLKITGRWDFAASSPLKVVPWDSYRIETRMRFDDGVDNLHSYGIMWGGDWDGSTPCPNEGLTSCFNHYYRLNVLWYGANDQLRTQVKRIDYHDEDGVGRGESLAGYADNGVNSPSGGWQIWTIDQTSNGTIRLYINGNLKRTITGDSTYAGAGTYFGVLATSNEYSGAEPWVDWFKVIPLD